MGWGQTEETLQSNPTTLQQNDTTQSEDTADTVDTTQRYLRDAVADVHQHEGVGDTGAAVLGPAPAPVLVLLVNSHLQ